LRKIGSSFEFSEDTIKKIKKMGKQGNTFVENFYYPKGTKCEIDLKLIPDHSIYNIEGCDTFEIDEKKNPELYWADKWVHRKTITWDWAMRQRLQEFTKKNEAELSRIGWFGTTLVSVENGHPSYGQQVKIGKRKFRLRLIKELLQIIPSKVVNLRKDWLRWAYLFKGIQAGAMEARPNNEKLHKAIYLAFDEFCKGANGYNAENNEKIFKSLTSMSLDYNSLIDTALIYGKMKTLKVLEVSRMEYEEGREFNTSIYHTKNLETYKHIPDCIDGPGVEILMANMSCGKTAKVLEFVNKRPDMSVIIVTTRISLALDFQKRFKGFTLYSDVDGILDQPRLIVQLESLPRLQRSELYDCVIFDEQKELLQQFASGNHRDMGALKMIYEDLIRNCSMVKVLDAFVDDQVLEWIWSYRQDVTFRKCTKQPRKDFDNVFTGEKRGLELYMNALDAGKKLVCGINVIEKGKRLERIAINKGKKVLFIHAETDAETKKSIIQDEKVLEGVDVFIFSPTIVVGVSIQVPFDQGFYFFGNSSNTVSSCMQMTARVRNIRDKRNTYCIKENLQDRLPVDDKAIDRIFVGKRGLFNTTWAGNHGAERYLDDNRKIRFGLDKPWYCGLRGIVKYRGQSHNEYLGRFLSHLKITGGRIIDETKMKISRFIVSPFPDADGQLTDRMIPYPPIFKRYIDKIDKETMEMEYRAYLETELLNWTEFKEIIAKPVKTKKEEKKIDKTLLHNLYSLASELPNSEDYKVLNTCKDTYTRLRVVFRMLNEGLKLRNMNEEEEWKKGDTILVSELNDYMNHYVTRILRSLLPDDALNDAGDSWKDLKHDAWDGIYIKKADMLKRLKWLTERGMHDKVSHAFGMEIGRAHV
jgi:hypothetical protein